MVDSFQPANPAQANLSCPMCTTYTLTRIDCIESDRVTVFYVKWPRWNGYLSRWPYQPTLTNRRPSAVQQRLLSHTQADCLSFRNDEKFVYNKVSCTKPFSTSLDRKSWPRSVIVIRLLAEPAMENRDTWMWAKDCTHHTQGLIIAHRFGSGLFWQRIKPYCKAWLVSVLWPHPL